MAGDLAPPTDDGADQRAVAALDELRALVGGAARLDGDDALELPSWVTLADRARAQWSRVPAALRGAAAMLLAVAALLATWWLLRPAPVPAEHTLPAVGAAGAAVVDVAPPTTSAMIVAHAAGAVREPGLEVLTAGSRVADLLDAAGGPTADADLDRLNLAAPLTDGVRVYVPVAGEPVPVVVAPLTESSVSSAPLDLNTASAAALEALPGVGPATAAAIVAHRAATGPFGSTEELLGVRGIGPAKLEAMAPLIVVSR